VFGRSSGLWRHSDFLKYWSAQSLSLAGMQFGNLALPLVAVLTLDASAAEAGVLSGIGGLPWMLFGLLAGVAVDRFRRRVILVAAHCGRALLLASVPVAVGFGVLSMAQLYVVAFLTATLSMCFEIAYQSYLPSLVARDQLAEGNSKLAATDGVARTVGPGLAGTTVQVLTAPLALGANAICYLASGLLLWLVRRPEPAPERQARRSFWRSFVAGLAFTWRHALVRALALSEATYEFFFSMMYAVLFVFLSRELSLAPGVIGAIFAAGSVGGILGAFAARRAGERFGRRAAMVGGSLLRSGGLAAMLLSIVAGPFAVPVLIGARLCNAFGWTVWQVHQETTQQLVTPVRLLGRVNGSMLFVVRGMGALGGFAAAALAAAHGVVPTLVIGAVGAALAVVALLAAPAAEPVTYERISRR
jgi:MFS family permease